MCHLPKTVIHLLQTIYLKILKIIAFFIFGKRYLDLNRVGRNLKKGRLVQDLRFHDLRHEAISRMFEKGLNHMEVSSISGHKSLCNFKEI
jgi:integrase